VEYFQLPAAVDEELKSAALVLLYGTNLFVPVVYLRAKGVPVTELRLTAGEMLIARGDWIHCGLNLSEYSMSAAVNYIDETWLGPSTRTVVMEVEIR
jgi:hypothetical protein